MAEKYSRDELVGKLNAPGWRTLEHGEEGTLRQVAEAAHARRAQGHPPGRLQEIATSIEVELIQLEELWHHLGLPV